jgi:hypothetical protein
VRSDLPGGRVSVFDLFFGGVASSPLICLSDQAGRASLNPLKNQD